MRMPLTYQTLVLSLTLMLVSSLVFGQDSIPRPIV
ncbi:MAG: hypothetical protein ACJAWH_001706, partial [Maribacter sp.]